MQAACERAGRKAESGILSRSFITSSAELDKMNNKQDGYAYRPAFSFEIWYKKKTKWKYLPIRKLKIIVTKAKNEEKQRYFQQ